MKPMRDTLRALTRLLSYPDEQLRSGFDALLVAIDEEGALSAARRNELRALLCRSIRSTRICEISLCRRCNRSAVCD